MSKYLELITKDEKQVKTEEAAIRNQEGALQVDYAIIAASKKVNDCNNYVANSMKAVPFDPVAVIDAKRDLEEATQDLNDLKALKEELF